MNFTVITVIVHYWETGPNYCNWFSVIFNGKIETLLNGLKSYLEAPTVALVSHTGSEVKFLIFVFSLWHGK